MNNSLIYFVRLQFRQMTSYQQLILQNLGQLNGLLANSNQVMSINTLISPEFLNMETTNKTMNKKL